MVICSKCGFSCTEENAGEHFHKSSDGRSKKWRSACKNCANLQNANYYKNNQEKAIERGERNRARPGYKEEHQNRYFNRRYTDHEASLQADAKRHEQNRQSPLIRARNSKYTLKYLKTPKGVALRKKLQAKRRALVKQPNMFETITLVQWEYIVEALCDNKCFYCGVEFTAQDPATMEHIVPLSRGGSHTKSNITAACGGCNSSKGSKTLEEYRSMKRCMNE